MAQLMPKLETAHNFGSYFVFNILKVDSQDSGIYSGRCKRDIWVSSENRNIWVFSIFKLFCRKGLKILNVSSQNFFCKNVNHLNLFCVLFVEDILCEKSKFLNQTRVGPDWASHILLSFYKSTCLMVIQQHIDSNIDFQT